MKHRLALIGFGNVGQGLLSILVEKKEVLRREYGFEFEVVAVCDMLKGSLRDDSGLDAGKLLELAAGTLESYPGGTRGGDALTVIRESNATVVVEASYTDLATGEPATSHLKAAFETGKHVVTTNKGPLALHYSELVELARARNVQFRFEGTVMSGTPLISFGTRNLAGCEIREIRGIFNGTTNFILTEMEKGQEYAEALRKAQELGYAEADPTGDVEGFDTMGKVLILSNVFMGGRLRKEDIARVGITSLTPDDIRRAAAEGKRWKLIGSVRQEGDRVVGSVGPQALPLANPLTSVMGATNAAQFATDLLGEITVVGAGAGRRETGFAILADLLDIHRTTA
ncbi:MAG TPA: homoserine dehydrogenase [Thermoanaerobaculaceae bacterium]|nr:homoserine dehydrogenase [Thermoanaerobaculaceae bacterium]HRS16462.1 homoserine dehydrogenase [Thermoanaerobaculaceae bacterium]